MFGLNEFLTRSIEKTVQSIILECFSQDVYDITVLNTRSEDYGLSSEILQKTLTVLLCEMRDNFKLMPTSYISLLKNLSGMASKELCLTMFINKILLPALVSPDGVLEDCFVTDRARRGLIEFAKYVQTSMSDKKNIDQIEEIVLFKSDFYSLIDQHVSHDITHEQNTFLSSRSILVLINLSRNLNSPHFDSKIKMGNIICDDDPLLVEAIEEQKDSFQTYSDYIYELDRVLRVKLETEKSLHSVQRQLSNHQKRIGNYFCEDIYFKNSEKITEYSMLILD